MLDETLWHKCNPPLLPRRTISGGWATGPGQVWRRRSAQTGKWEYQQDEETEEEFLSRQW